MATAIYRGREFSFPPEATDEEIYRFLEQYGDEMVDEYEKAGGNTSATQQQAPADEGWSLGKWLTSSNGMKPSQTPVNLPSMDVEERLMEHRSEGIDLKTEANQSAGMSYEAARQKALNDTSKEELEAALMVATAPIGGFVGGKAATAAGRVAFTAATEGAVAGGSNAIAQQVATGDVDLVEAGVNAGVAMVTAGTIRSGSELLTVNNRSNLLNANDLKMAMASRAKTVADEAAGVGLTVKANQYKDAAETLNKSLYDPLATSSEKAKLFDSLTKMPDSSASSVKKAAKELIEETVDASMPSGLTGLALKKVKQASGKILEGLKAEALDAAMGNASNLTEFRRGAAALTNKTTTPLTRENAPEKTKKNMANRIRGQR